jgi:hypothetical protein
MDDTIEIPIRDLPQQLTQEVNTHIRLFAVTMLITDREDSNVTPCAGTLATIKGRKGVITARHVWQEITKHEFLFIMLGRMPHILEVNLLYAVVPPTQSRNAKISSDIPDLAFVILPEPSTNILEAKSKVFLSIDKRLEMISIQPLKNKIGYFALFGAPEQLIDYQHKHLPSFIYSTYISEYFQYEGWDYQIMGIDLDKNIEIPKSFCGMSGGGIWKVNFAVNDEKTMFAIKNPDKDIALVGVHFNQTALPGRQIVGHGPDSIYQALRSFIK